MHRFIKEFIIFGLKQAWACLFGGVILAAILLSKFLWNPAWPLARYDALFLFALAVQIFFLAFRLENRREALVIFLFHLVSTCMELYKTKVGSWVYPEANLIRIGGVPLFTGFMYSCVGSYMARVMHTLDLRFTHYPSLGRTALVAALIYINFFTHHFLWDFRWLLMLAVGAVWARSWLYYKPADTYYRMPVLVGFALVAFFIWIAENVGTFGRIWMYPNQQIWEPVGFAKLVSWFLLMIVSCVLVTLINRPREYGQD